MYFHSTFLSGHYIRDYVTEIWQILVSTDLKLMEGKRTGRTHTKNNIFEHLKEDNLKLWVEFKLRL